MKILIVDDEPLARSRLKRLLNKMPQYECIAEADNTAEAMAIIKRQQPNVVLLDIQMPTESGLQLAEQVLHLPVPPTIIFVTAHPEHALAAYNVSAIDYILKPVSASRLEQALNRMAPRTPMHSAVNVRKISYYLAGTLRQVEVDKVSYFIADDKYVRMVFDGGHALIEQSLQQLEQQFPDLLQRIHRHTVVNWPRFESLHSLPNGTSKIRLVGCEDILDVSRREATRLRQLLNLK